MPRPDPTPTDPRLFPSELTASSELDSKALDDIRAALLNPKLGAFEALNVIALAVRTTGRDVGL